MCLERRAPLRYMGRMARTSGLAGQALALYEAIEHPDAAVVRERLAQWWAAGSE